MASVTVLSSECQDPWLLRAASGVAFRAKTWGPSALRAWQLPETLTATLSPHSLLFSTVLAVCLPLSPSSTVFCHCHLFASAPCSFCPCLLSGSLQWPSHCYCFCSHSFGCLCLLLVFPAQSPLPVIKIKILSGQEKVILEKVQKKSDVLPTF
jgi:hypothetical protein